MKRFVFLCTLFLVFLTTAQETDFYPYHEGTKTGWKSRSGFIHILPSSIALVDYPFVQTRSGKWGMLDKKGALQLDTIYTHLSYMSISNQALKSLGDTSKAYIVFSKSVPKKIAGNNNATQPALGLCKNDGTVILPEKYLAITLLNNQLLSLQTEQKNDSNEVEFLYDLVNDKISPTSYLAIWRYYPLYNGTQTLSTNHIVAIKKTRDTTNLQYDLYGNSLQKIHSFTRRKEFHPSDGEYGFFRDWLTVKGNSFLYLIAGEKLVDSLPITWQQSRQFGYNLEWTGKITGTSFIPNSSPGYMQLNNRYQNQEYLSLESETLCKLYDRYGNLQAQSSEYRLAYDARYKDLIFIVTKGGTIGIMSMKGEILIPPKYDLHSFLNENGFWMAHELIEALPKKTTFKSVVYDSGFRKIDFDTLGISQVVLDEQDTLFITYSTASEKFGLMNRKGELLVPAVWHRIEKSKDGPFIYEIRQRSSQNENRPIEELNVGLFIPYDQAYTGKSGSVIRVQYDDGIGFADATNKTPPTDIYNRENTQILPRAIIVMNRREGKGIADLSGKMLVPLNHDYIELIEGSNTIVQIDAKNGERLYNTNIQKYICKSGNRGDVSLETEGADTMILFHAGSTGSSIYEDGSVAVKPWVQRKGDVYVRQSGRKYRVTDRNGTAILSGKYDRAVILDPSIIFLQQQNMFYVYNTTSKEKKPFLEESLRIVRLKGNLFILTYTGDKGWVYDAFYNKLHDSPFSYASSAIAPPRISNAFMMNDYQLYGYPVELSSVLFVGTNKSYLLEPLSGKMIETTGKKMVWLGEQNTHFMNYSVLTAGEFGQMIIYDSALTIVGEPLAGYNEAEICSEFDSEKKVLCLRGSGRPTVLFDPLTRQFHQIHLEGKEKLPPYSASRTKRFWLDGNPVPDTYHPNSFSSVSQPGSQGNKRFYQTVTSDGQIFWFTERNELYHISEIH